MNTIKKKIKLKEDSGNYVTKITLGDKGDIDSMKVRRTVGGFLRGAPRVSKVEAQPKAEAKAKADAKTAEAQAAISYKKGGNVGTSKKPKMAKGGSFGMLSVKKGIDNNPKPTAADRIAGATMKKSGMVKKSSKKK